MRKLLTIPFALIGLLFTYPVAAQESAGDVETIPVEVGEDDGPPEELPSVFYSTIGLSYLDPDFTNVDGSVNLEATMVGLRVPTFPWVGLELNGSFTMIPGEIRSPNCGGLGGPCPDNVASSNTDFGANMFGLYGVARSPGMFFATGKIGLYRLWSIQEFDDETSGTAWALGGGYRWEPYSFVELTYTKINDRLNGYGLTFSYSLDR